MPFVLFVVRSSVLSRRVRRARRGSIVSAVRGEEVPQVGVGEEAELALAVRESVERADLDLAGLQLLAEEAGNLLLLVNVAQRVVLVLVGHELAAPRGHRAYRP